MSGDRGADFVSKGIIDLSFLKKFIMVVSLFFGVLGSELLLLQLEIYDPRLLVPTSGYIEELRSHDSKGEDLSWRSDPFPEMEASSFDPRLKTLVLFYSFLEFLSVLIGLLAIRFYAGDIRCLARPDLMWSCL